MFQNRFLHWLERMIPAYAWVPLAVSMFSNPFVYQGSRLINRFLVHHNVTLAWDAYVPFVPAFIIVYVLSYVQWFVTYICMARDERQTCYNFFTWSVFGKLVCLLFFIAFPTSIVRPEVTGTGLIPFLLRSIYAADIPNNLFPSIHCLMSWLCFRAFLSSGKYPRRVSVAMLLMTLAVFASTVLVRQHVLIDIVGGLAVAEAVIYCTKRFSLCCIFDRWKRYTTAAPVPGKEPKY